MILLLHYLSSLFFDPLQFQSFLPFNWVSFMFIVCFHRLIFFLKFLNSLYCVLIGAKNFKHLPVVSTT